MQVVHCLGEGADCETVDGAGWTALLLAARGGHNEAVLALLQHGAAHDARERRASCCALHLAAHRGDCHMIHSLSSYGADLEPTASPGFTPLHLAARAGHHHAVSTLISLGADPNPGCDTPLQLAVVKGHVEVVRCLLEYGVPVGVGVGGGGLGALSMAAGAGHTEVVALLIAHGADVDAADSGGDAPLHVAATPCVRPLHQWGASTPPRPNPSERSLALTTLRRGILTFKCPHVFLLFGFPDNRYRRKYQHKECLPSVKWGDGEEEEEEGGEVAGYSRHIARQVCLKYSNCAELTGAMLCLPSAVWKGCIAERALGFR